MSVATKAYGFYSTAPKQDTGRLTWDDPRHGTVNGYNNCCCRCDDCKAAWSVYLSELRKRRRSMPIPDHVHGTDNGYSNWYCKCDDCREAHRATYKPSLHRWLEREKTEAMYADYSSGMPVEDVAKKYELSDSAVYLRFRTAGLKLHRASDNTAAMYMDYCTGMSTGEVAEKWGVSRKTVTDRFKQLGVPLRPRKGGPSYVTPVPAGVPWREANRVRAEEAGARRAYAAQMALASTVDPIPRQVLELRIAYPRMSLTELAKRCDPPMTKDAYAGHLRRALAAVS